MDMAEIAAASWFLYAVLSAIIVFHDHGKMSNLNAYDLLQAICMAIGGFSLFFCLNKKAKAPPFKLIIAPLICVIIIVAMLFVFKILTGSPRVPISYTAYASVITGITCLVWSVLQTRLVASKKIG